MKAILTIALLFGAGSGAFAASSSISHDMTTAMIQLAIIIFFGWIGGKLAGLVKLPAVVGQIILGVAISPFALGGIPIPGFPDGVFPQIGSPVAVSEIVYTFSTLAAIILLFMSGLETDLKLFVRYAGKGSIVGIGGVVVSFFAGAALVAIFFDQDIFSIQAMFTGALCVATSVGITANLLSHSKKIDSPEGTTILSAAVIDDILGIVILSVVMGLADSSGAGTSSSIADIILRAAIIVGAISFLGLTFAKGIGRGLKIMGSDKSTIAVLALGLTLFVSGLVELGGLSMIIGAYFTGLALSNTELAVMLQSKLKVLMSLLVPVLFVVSGMMVDIKAIVQPDVLGLGLLFTVLAVLAKLIGSGFPALFMNFNFLGAMRIGWGMVPRGEVALIIAGIGASASILSPTLFGIGMLMTVGTTIIAPPVLERLLKVKKSGQRKEIEVHDKESTELDFGSKDFAELMLNRFLVVMKDEGFYVNRHDHEPDSEHYLLRKDSIFFSMKVTNTGKIHFESDPDAAGYIRLAIHEGILQIGNSVGLLNVLFHHEDLAKAAHTAAGRSKAHFKFAPYVSPARVSLSLKAKNKNEVLSELLGLYGNDVTNPEKVLEELKKREEQVTSALEEGITIPHCKTQFVKKTLVAVGLAPAGIDCGSMDGKPSKLFFMILSPRNGGSPHLHLLSALASRLQSAEVREKLLAATSPEELLALLTPPKSKTKK